MKLFGSVECCFGQIFIVADIDEHALYNGILIFLSISIRFGYISLAKLWPPMNAKWFWNSPTVDNRISLVSSANSLPLFVIFCFTCSAPLFSKLLCLSLHDVAYDSTNFLSFCRIFLTSNNFWKQNDWTLKWKCKTTVWMGNGKAPLNTEWKTFMSLIQND